MRHSQHIIVISILSFGQIVHSFLCRNTNSFLPTIASKSIRSPFQIYLVLESEEESKKTSESSKNTNSEVGGGSTSSNNNIKKDPIIYNEDFFLPTEERSVDDYTGKVDWDAEWKKVAKNNDQLRTNRPGKDFYKSDAEIAAIRATNKATEQAARLAAKVPSIPSWDSLKGDWKFWIGIIAVISIATSVVSGIGVSSIPNNADPGSYYI